MARLPTVAIVGRPNTGKSRLFNRLLGRRKSIVSDIPGTTRDRVAARVSGGRTDYLLVDTGGIGGGTRDRDLEDDVEAQSLLALENADVILFTVDSRGELTASDYTVIDHLRRKPKRHVPVILVLTKCDNPAATDAILPPFYALGISEEIIPVSAPHNLGIDALQNAVEDALEKLHFARADDGAAPLASGGPRIAIVGRPNVGKSSIINAFLHASQRATSGLLVSDIPGTTRDATDTVVVSHGREYTLVDTAGIRRAKGTKDEIDMYAHLRSLQAIGECDIAVLAVDASLPMTKLDKRIAGMAIEEGKGLVILANKIDLVLEGKRGETLQALASAFAFCRYAPILPCSAATREGLRSLFDIVHTIEENRSRRIPTKELIRWFEETVEGQPLSSVGSSKHITQAEELPPTFVLFVKNPKQVQVSQLRHLDNAIRRSFDFTGTPLRWVTKTA